MSDDDPGQDRDPAEGREAPDPARDPVEDLAEVPWQNWREVAARLVPFPMEDLQPVELQPWPAGGQTADDEAALEAGEAGEASGDEGPA
jgi:hypothetical protein